MRGESRSDGCYCAMTPGLCERAQGIDGEISLYRVPKGKYTSAYGSKMGLLVAWTR